MQKPVCVKRYPTCDGAEIFIEFEIHYFFWIFLRVTPRKILLLDLKEIQTFPREQKREWILESGVGYFPLSEL